MLSGTFHELLKLLKRLIFGEIAANTVWCFEQLLAANRTLCNLVTKLELPDRQYRDVSSYSKTHASQTKQNDIDWHLSWEYRCIFSGIQYRYKSA